MARARLLSTPHFIPQTRSLAVDRSLVGMSLSAAPLETKSRSKLEPGFKGVGGRLEDSVEVNISYDIIRQVSAQLYTNPRKAIEELVCNSYDAGATECWIKLPSTAEDPLIVLDNGKSMDLSGVKELWRIAWSPKAKEGEGKPRIDNDRMQIGKFGVGKLATFALGKRLTHIACDGENVRFVSVGQSEIREQEGGGRPRFEISKASIDTAKTFLQSCLADLPKPWDRKWDKWTIAFIEEIESQTLGGALKVGFLRQMIATALPISARFKVYLEGALVPQKEIDPSQVEVRVDVTVGPIRKRIEEALQAHWQGMLGKAKIEDVPSDYYKLKSDFVENPQKVSEKVAAIRVPYLGAVMGNAVLTKTSLTTEKLAERGYQSNGFFVYVHGKLVNPENPLFGVTQRSHRYWRRFRASLEMPGLDEVLLVQRNAVSEGSPQFLVAREVLRTVFNFVRQKGEEKEEKAKEPVEFGKRLRSLSPILAPQAVVGLFRDTDAGTTLQPLNIDKIEIEFATLGEDSPAARFDPTDGRILINEDHPLVIALDDVTKSKALRHMIGEVLGGTQMIKGYLRIRGVDSTIVDDVDEIMEVSLRSAANFVRDEVQAHITAIEEASHQGGAPFENAVVTAFRGLRVTAKRLGAADEPDGIVVIPMSGKPNLRISIEAKGSQGVVTHKQLSEATISRQRKEQGCTHAVAIAREFQTRGRGGRPSALLREKKRKLTLMTVEAIAHLLNLHKTRHFSYEQVAAILTTFKWPQNMIPHIDKMWRKLPDLGLMRLILQVAHDNVVADSKNYPDPGMIIAGLRAKGREVQRDDVIAILRAIQVTTGKIVILNDKDYTFRLIAPVETILEDLVKEPEQSQAEVKSSNG